MCSNRFSFSIDPVTGRANVRRHEDPMKGWSDERKMVEVEQLVNHLDRAMK
jgi:hypothetical protein